MQAVNTQSARSRVSSTRTPRVSRGYHAVKRATDVAGASLGILLSAPVVLACAAWIKACDRGPVIHKQWRVGHNGKLFRLYKLRTMRLNAEAPGVARFATAGDPRVLPLCGWMRKSHVDELPQLWNILRGEMSLVGPRPERPEMIEELRPDVPQIDRRLECAPGLTGLAQVKNGYASDISGTRRKVAMDLRYMRNRSVWNEFRLLLATVPKLWDRTGI